MDSKINNNIKISSNQSFGVVFFVVFLLIALYPITYSGYKNMVFNNFSYLYNFRAIKL